MSLEKTVADLIIKSQSESFSKDEAYQFLDQARILIMEVQDKIRKKPEIKPDPGIRPEYYQEYEADWKFHYGLDGAYREYQRSRRGY